MKKTLRMLVAAACLMAAGDSFASIGVAWSSTTYFYKNGGNPANYPADYLPTDALRILIWSANLPPTVGYALPTTGIGANEYILQTVNSGSDSGTLDLTAADIVKNNTDVGGNNINNGYLYSRIFSSGSPVAGEWYFQSAYIGPTLAVYDAMNPATTIHHISSDVDTYPELEMGAGGAQSGMFQVQAIPEPGTLLLALPFFGVMAVRRLRKQD